LIDISLGPPFSKSKWLEIIDFHRFSILEKPATRPRDRCGVRSSLFIPSLPVFPAPAESPPLLPIAQAAESGPRCQLRMPAAT